MNIDNIITYINYRFLEKNGLFKLPFFFQVSYLLTYKCLILTLALFGLQFFAM